MTYSSLNLDISERNAFIVKMDIFAHDDFLQKMDISQQMHLIEMWKLEIIHFNRKVDIFELDTFLAKKWIFSKIIVFLDVMFFA